MKISVLLISYNGACFIKDQLDSIIREISAEDEIIVSDDGSTDGTVEIVRACAQANPNIKLVSGPHSGIAANLSNAYRHSDGDLIFFSDQDDEWLPEKVSRVKACFDAHPELQVVMHNAYMCNADNEVVDEDKNIFALRNAGHGVFRNIIKSTYYGCCMAFRREFLDWYMPLPEQTVAYDQFLGLCAEYRHCVGFLQDELIKHRIHGSNQSQKQPLGKKIMFRIKMVKHYRKYKNGI